jgi:hypothetical protein
MSGCVSSEGWRVQQEVDLPGARVRSLVVRIAGWRETKILKRRLRVDSERRCGLENEWLQEPSPQP